MKDVRDIDELENLLNIKRKTLNIYHNSKLFEILELQPHVAFIRAFYTRKP